ncbi:MAG: lipopolysaccharide transport periplasmic protein LptA [Burkholderiales bacterium]|nr:lipopolysaccharide transport periplasmic protein LptA [Burkholderiales bacterium]
MNPVLIRSIAPIVAAMLALFTHTVQAERADRDKPVNLESNTVEVNDQTKVSVYQGNVRLTQGTLLITAEKLVVTQDDDGFSKSTAYGSPTYFKQKRDGVDELTEGWAQRLDYDAKRDKVEMFTQARIKRGQDEVRGSYIAYDGQTESYRVLGGKEAATEYNPKGRVRAVIQPKRRGAAAAPSDGGLPLKPAEGVKQVQ